MSKYQFPPGTYEQTVELGTELLWCLWLDGPFWDTRPSYDANANELLQQALKARGVDDRRVNDVKALSTFSRKLASPEFGRAVKPKIVGKRTLGYALGIEPADLPPAPAGWEIPEEKDILADRREGNFLWPLGVPVKDRMLYKQVIWTLFETGRIENNNASRVLRMELGKRDVRVPAGKLGELIRNMEGPMFHGIHSDNEGIIGRVMGASMTRAIWLRVNNPRNLPPNPFTTAAGEELDNEIEKDEFDEDFDEFDIDAIDTADLEDEEIEEDEGNDLDDGLDTEDDEGNEEAEVMAEDVHELFNEDELLRAIEEQASAPQLVEPTAATVPAPLGSKAIATYDQEVAALDQAMLRENPITYIASAMDTLGALCGHLATHEAEITARVRAEADEAWSRRLAEIREQYRRDLADRDSTIAGKDELIQWQQAALVNRGTVAAQQALEFSNARRAGK